MIPIAVQTENIKREFYPTHSPSVTVVEYKDGSSFNGFFQDFDDYEELSEKGQCRFIPMNKIIDLRKEKNKTGKINPEYSVVIDFTVTKNIKLVQRGILLKQINLE